MNAYDIILIILASFLAVFLVLAIILAVFLIQIAARIRLIVAKAELVADKVENVAEFFQKTAGPVAIARLISNITNHFSGNNGKKRRD